MDKSAPTLNSAVMIRQQQQQLLLLTSHLVSFLMTLLNNQVHQSLFSDAVLITGSDTIPRDTAELYLPSTGYSCSLPQLPDQREEHTLESSGLMCGGFLSDTRYTCLQWSPDTGSWEQLLRLDAERENHVSWTPDNGIGTYLMGGYGYDSDSGTTTTLVKHDGTQEAAFALKHVTR